MSRKKRFSPGPSFTRRAPDSSANSLLSSAPALQEFKPPSPQHLPFQDAPASCKPCHAALHSGKTFPRAVAKLPTRRKNQFLPWKSRRVKAAMSRRREPFPAPRCRHHTTNRRRPSAEDGTRPGPREPAGRRVPLREPAACPLPGQASPSRPPQPLTHTSGRFGRQRNEFHFAINISEGQTKPRKIHTPRCSLPKDRQNPFLNIRQNLLAKLPI